MSTDWQERLDRVLYYFDVDIFSENRRGQEHYNARLWQDGGQVAEVSHETLPGLIVELDRAAERLMNDDPPAWACGQDPYRCESCGSLIREDLTCPRCDAADELEERLQAIVSEARKAGGEL